MAGNKKPQPGLSVRQATEILASVPPPRIVAILQDPSLAMLTAFVFDGTPTIAACSDPRIQRSLAEEGIKSSLFVQKLRELQAVHARLVAAAASKVAAEKASARAAVPPRQVPSPVFAAVGAAQPTLSRPAAVSGLKSSPSIDEHSAPAPSRLTSSPLPANGRIAPDPEIAKLKTERDRISAELSAELARRTSERDAERDRRELAERNVARVSAEAAELREQVEHDARRYQYKIVGLERALYRMDREADGLRAQAAGFEKQKAANEASRAEAAFRADGVRWDRPFVEAVRRLLDRQRYRQARGLTEDVLRDSPSDTDALEIHCAACEGVDDHNAAIRDLRRLITVHSTHADFPAAARSLVRLLAYYADPTAETRRVRDFFVAMERQPGDRTEVKAVFERVRFTSPLVYSLLHQSAHGALRDELFDLGAEDGALGDSPIGLPLSAGLPRAVTGRQVLRWIKCNDSESVNAVRAAVRETGMDAVAAVASAVAASAGEDAIASDVVRCDAVLHPVIVNASNVAWGGQEMMADGGARIGQVSAVRRALWERGYFPTFLIGDANLPRVADNGELARQMIADGEMTVVDAGVDADEVILREARRLACPVVTNDLMKEWDPDGDVEKIPFAIDPSTGAASLIW